MSFHASALFALGLCAVIAAPAARAADMPPIPELFALPHTQTLLMRMEAALAKVQARRGIIPREAAEEIARTANLDAVPQAEVAAEFRRVGHPLVALLNVWAKKTRGDAGEYIHYGATTQDIYDTVQLRQCREAALVFIRDLRQIEETLLKVAREHRATPMIGRTVGRHALPFTFGVKVASWLGENRRNIERLKGWLSRNDTAMISGAVGSYAALGKDAFDIEAEVAKELGASEPWPADWKGAKDMFAEYGALLAITSKSLGRIAQEIFLLQGDDFREIEEPTTNVGSSTMPHKVNPSFSRAVLTQARAVPHLADILRDWQMSYYERDQVSSADALGDVSAAMDKLTKAAARMVANMKVNPEAMARDLGRTNGLVMAEEAMFLLGEKIGKHTAHEEVRLAARAAWDKNTQFIDEIMARPALVKAAAEIGLAQKLDPKKYIGLSPQATDRTIAAIERARMADPEGAR